MDCDWSEWSSWSLCSKTCQPKFQRQERRILKVERNGGQPCDGLSEATRDCLEEDCIWSEWSPWSFCSKTCQPKFQTRKRKVLQEEVYGGKPCDGLSDVTRDCLDEDCLKSKGCNTTVCRTSTAYATVFFLYAKYANKTSFTHDEFHDVFSAKEVWYMERGGIYVKILGMKGFIHTTK